MSKFTYPRMQIRMRISAREAPRMRIHMRMIVQEDPWMRIHMKISVPRYPRTRMRIFMTFLNKTSYYQMGAAFITEYRIAITDYKARTTSALSTLLLVLSSIIESFGLSHYLAFTEPSLQRMVQTAELIVIYVTQERFPLVQFSCKFVQVLVNANVVIPENMVILH